MTSRHFVLAGILAATSFSLPVAAQDHHWGYEGEGDPSHWGELSDDWKECSIGTEQSPIDIVAARAIPAEFSPVEVHWTAFVPQIVDNGHTIQVNSDGKGGYVTVNGIEYKLLQFHLHHQSEHAFAGVHSPLEVHFVHQSEAGDLLVLGVLMNEGQPSVALDSVQNVWPAVGTPYAGTDAFDPSAFLPVDRTSFRYQGSLTTPPCSQTVTWNVFMEPIEVSAAQVTLFASHYANNARPIQPLNRRFLLVSEAQ